MGASDGFHAGLTQAKAKELHFARRNEGFHGLLLSIYYYRVLLQTIFTTTHQAQLFVTEGTPFFRLTTQQMAAAKGYELALFAGRQSTYDVESADYGWEEADFTTHTGLLLCDSQLALATHLGIIMPALQSCRSEFAGLEPYIWVGGTERGGIFGYNAAFFAL